MIGIWSVRELKRQISGLYYERSGLSAKPEKLSELVQQNTMPQKTSDSLKNIYSFEFLDLKVKDVVEESDLETALIDHLKEFIIEMGNGFCFEARQKKDSHLRHRFGRGAASTMLFLQALPVVYA
jgi:predicted nuclease of restriction endonuclease-like (RecB) superfamily